MKRLTKLFRKRAILMATPVVALGVAGLAYSYNQPAEHKTPETHTSTSEVATEEQPVAEVFEKQVVKEVPKEQPANQSRQMASQSQDEKNKERFKKDVQAAYPFDDNQWQLSWSNLDKRVNETVGYSNYESIMTDEIVHMYFVGKQTENGKLKIAWNPTAKYYTVPN